MESVWSATCSIKNREPLRNDIKCDVAVVGAGMAGILTAYLLQQRGVDVVVLEANEIASGVTKNTTAKITSQHNLIYDRLIKELGAEKAQQYAAANEAAIGKYADIINDQSIDCNFVRKPAYVYSLHNTDRIEQEVKAAQNLDIDAHFTTQTTLPFEVKGAVRFENQAQFNPLKFIKVISENLRIYEHTMVRDIDDKYVLLDNARVWAENIIVATHFPFINSRGFYFAKMHQDRSYVLALENAAELDGVYIDCDESGYTFRNYENLLFFGGAGHRTGENKEGGCYNLLRQAAKKYYPDSMEQYHWSAQDCITHDGVPCIGQYCVTTPNLYVATGFNKWGMTGSMVSAMILTDKITGRKNETAEVFSPQRFNPGATFENLMEDSAHAVKGLVKQNFTLPEKDLEHIKPGHGGIVEYEGEKVGVYKDEGGAVYTVSTRCPHLGCQLAWNPDELTWECPCHGSRFDYRGDLINNPAMRGLEKS